MLKTAIEAAKKSAEVTLKYFNNQPTIQYKIDKTPVTIADQQAEKLIRKIVSKRFPNHGFVGEEFGNTKPNAQYKWVIDPIDGTKSFIRGIKYWGTLISVLKDNEPIIGVYSSPATGEIFWAEKGKGTFLNGKRIQLSKISQLEKSFIGYGSIHYFQKHNKTKQLLKLCESSQSRMGSSDCQGFNYLLKGQIDAFIFAHAYIYDIAAHVVLVKEAGGRFCDFNGDEILTNDNGIFTNGLLHSKILKILNSK